MAKKTAHFLWHEQFMPQLAQLHPHEHFPFFFPLNRLTITAATITTRIADITIVPAFSAKKPII
jgi:hypothetical protein